MEWEDFANQLDTQISLMEKIVKKNINGIFP